MAKKITCPLCQEKHSVPKNGLQGFRKDFRIQNLVEKARSQKKGKGKSGDACQKHSGYKKRLYCKNRACLAFICQECWSEDHAKHDVVILSQVVEKLKVDGQKQIDAQSEKLRVHIADLLNAKEFIGHSRETIKSTVKMELKRIEDSFKKFEKNVLARFDDGNKSLSDELDKLIKLQEKLNVLDNGFQGTVDENNVQSTLKQVNSLEKIISEWSLEYTYPDVEAKHLEVAAKTFEVRSLSKKFGNHGNNNGNIQPYVTATPQQIESPEWQAKKLCRWIIDGPSDLYGFCISIHYPDIVIKSSLMVRTNERSLGTLSMEPVLEGWPLNREIQKYQLSSVYHADKVGTITVCGTEYLVELDKARQQIRFSAWSPNNLNKEVSYVYPTLPETSFSMACDKDAVIYSCTHGDEICIEYIHVRNPFPSTLDTHIRKVLRTGFAKHRAICVLKSGYVQIIATNFHSPRTPRDSIAVRSLYLSGRVAWEISFEIFDSKAKRFDLCSMATDSQGVIFILNRLGTKYNSGNIYLVSSQGIVLKKLITGLERPAHIAYSPRSHRLCVNQQDDHLIYSVAVYELSCS